MNMKNIFLILGLWVGSPSQADQVKGIKSIHLKLQNFESRNPDLMDSRGSSCALRYSATLVNGNLRLKVGLTGATPPFEVGFKSEMYQSLSFGKRGELNPIVENSESDGYGYWSTDRRSLEIWESSITLSVYDYQTKKTISQTCYSINYNSP